MPNTFAQVEAAGVNFAFRLYGRFLELCPEEIWGETFGGRAVSRQFCHALAATAVYMQSLGAVIENPFPDLLETFAKAAAEELPGAPSRENAAEFLEQLRVSFARLISGIDDAALLKDNAPISAFLEGRITNAGVMEIMTAHLLYHLGSCDAALRSQGIPGAFTGLDLVKASLAKSGFRQAEA